MAPNSSRPLSILDSLPNKERNQILLILFGAVSLLVLATIFIIYWSKLRLIVTSLTKGDSLRYTLIERNVTPYTKKLEEKISRNAKVEIK
jgi:hypothetical protein